MQSGQALWKILLLVKLIPDPPHSCYFTTCPPEAQSTMMLNHLKGLACDHQICFPHCEWKLGKNSNPTLDPWAFANERFEFLSCIWNMGNQFKWLHSTLNESLIFFLFQEVLLFTISQKDQRNRCAGLLCEVSSNIMERSTFSIVNSDWLSNFLDKMGDFWAAYP